RTSSGLQLASIQGATGLKAFQFPETEYRPEAYALPIGRAGQFARHFPSGIHDYFRGYSGKSLKLSFTLLGATTNSAVRVRYAKVDGTGEDWQECPCLQESP